MTPQRTVRAAALAGLLGLAACGGGSGGTTEAQGAPATAEAPAVTPAPQPIAQPAATTAGAAAPAVDPAATTAVAAEPAPTVAVPPILQLTAPLVGGGELDFASFAGRPVAFWFWAPG